MAVDEKVLAAALARKFQEISFSIKRGDIDATDLRCPWCKDDSVVCCHFGLGATEYVCGEYFVHICLHDQCRYGVFHHFGICREDNVCPYSHGEHVASVMAEERAS